MIKVNRFALAMAVMIPSATFAGGLQHNNNQSAAWARTLSRAASLEGDAVFYNPAGVALFKDGFSISLSNQIPSQTRSISCDFAGLQQGSFKGDYKGDVFSAVFPGIYAAYKTGNWGFSLGFNPIGGGGNAKFEKGMPMLDAPIGGLAGFIGASAYDYEVNLEASSIFYGYQAGVAYKINDNWSVAAGLRVVNARNAYTGYMRNIRFDMNTGLGLTSLADLVSQLNAGATKTAAAATSLQPIIDLGAGSRTLSQLQTAGQLTAEQVATLAGGLGKDYDPAMTVEQVQTAYQTASAGYSAKAGALTPVVAATADKELDAKQTGTGFTPIIGVNFHSGKWNVAAKYEFKTKLELSNATTKDVDLGGGSGLFPDGVKSRSDLPALITLGADYQVLPKLKLSLSTMYYFDKNADYGTRTPFVDGNSYELAFGLEYAFTEKFLVGAGYQYVKYNVTDGYQTDFAQALSNNTFGVGAAYRFCDMVKINLGAFFAQYEDRKVPQGISLMGNNTGFDTTYGRKSMGFAIGVDLNF